MTQAEILKRLKRIYNKKSQSDVELLKSLVNLMDGIKNEIKNEFPELKHYDKNKTWCHSADETNTYRIIFKAHDEEYYFDTTAEHKNDALSTFFKCNPHINYSMITATICLNKENESEKNNDE